MISQLETRAVSQSSPADVELDNLLLARLDADDRAELERAGKTVRLNQGQLLFEPDDEILHVHFPKTGAVSLVMMLADGTGVESLMIGREGVTDAMSYASPQRAMARAVVQMPGEAFRVDAGRLRELVRLHPGIRAAMELYAGRALAELHQNSACNALHRLEPRLAKWLLNAHDRADGDLLPLTQEFLSDMLGAQRTTVTAVASSLQRTGAISYRRGRITVLDRSGLERASCECYAAAQRRAKVASRPV